MKETLKQKHERVARMQKALEMFLNKQEVQERMKENVVYNATVHTISKFISDGYDLLDISWFQLCRHKEYNPYIKGIPLK